MQSHVLNSRIGRAPRWRARPGWAWLSLQLLAGFLTLRVGELIQSYSLPTRLAMLLPVVLVLFLLADYVSDKVDERVGRTARCDPPVRS